MTKRLQVFILFVCIFINLSVVLPQLFVSLGLGIFIQNAEDKNLIFVISAVSLAISALLWFMVKESKAVEKSIKVQSSGH
ncbi:MAG: hypothetical protein MUO34_03510 [Ignavibacteriaceae bacterium]|nr:hypothetical protein [Ignavibacteriaceae bacterium]